MIVTDLEIYFGGDPYFGNPLAYHGLFNWYHLKIPGAINFLSGGVVTVGSSPNLAHITGDFKGRFYGFYYDPNPVNYWRDINDAIKMQTFQATLYQTNCAGYSINGYVYNMCPHSNLITFNHNYAG